MVQVRNKYQIVLKVGDKHLIYCFQYLFILFNLIYIGVMFYFYINFYTPFIFKWIFTNIAVVHVVGLSS